MLATKNKVITAAIIIAVLIGTFLWGGGYSRQTIDTSETTLGSTKDDVDTNHNVDVKIQEYQVDGEEQIDEIAKEEQTVNSIKEEKQEYVDKTKEITEKFSDENSPSVEAGSETYSEEKGMVIDASTGKDMYLTDPVPEGKPIPVEPQDAEVTYKELKCTLSVRCETILNNIDCLDLEKVELVPEDGVIYETTEVVFCEGESVFDVLLREMKNNNIHLEFENTPIYNSAYIEGINNLYEFDCGELSGWMYKVNDWFPNYGCSRYQLNDGDKIEWVYTCDLGRDVGGYSAVGN